MTVDSTPSTRFATRGRTGDEPTGAPAGTTGVRVVGLGRSFGSQRALDNVSFEVPPGSVCSLLGASGSGKTTTLRIIAGLDRPDAGEVWIGDRAMARGRSIVPAEQRGIGMFFQSYGLWPHKTVFGQIAYPLKVRRRSRDEIDQAVRKVADMLGIDGLLHRYPSELSGGQQQRVALARALVFGPSVLLLDEPLSNLDAALRRQTRLELQRLQAEVKLTTIYVTHDQEEAMAMSDVVVLMSAGKVVSIASPRETFDHPTTEYGASFVGASNVLKGSFTATEGDYALVELGPGVVVKGKPVDALSPGDPVLIAVKPVDLSIDTSGSPGSLLADVMAATYLGPQVELELAVAGQSFRMPDHRWSAVTVGDRVAVRFPADWVSVFAARSDP